MATSKKGIEVDVERTDDGKIKLTPKKKTTSTKSITKTTEKSTTKSTATKSTAKKKTTTTAASRTKKAVNTTDNKKKKAPVKKTTAVKTNTTKPEEPIEDTSIEEITPLLTHPISDDTIDSVEKSLQKALQEEMDNSILNNTDDLPLVEEKQTAVKEPISVENTIPLIEEKTTPIEEAPKELIIPTSSDIENSEKPTEELTGFANLQDLPEDILVEIIPENDNSMRPSTYEVGKDGIILEEDAEEARDRRRERRKRRRERIEKMEEEMAREREEAKKKEASEPPAHLRHRHEDNEEEKKEQPSGELPEELSNLKDKAIHTPDGKVMFPLNFGNKQAQAPAPVPEVPKQPVAPSAMTGNRYYGDPNSYIYLAVTPSSYGMNAEMLEFALCDNSNRTLYVQITDVLLHSVSPDVFLNVAQHLPKGVPSEINPSRPDWMIATTKEKAHHVLIEWLKPFIERRNRIQFVVDGDWQGYTLFMNFLTKGHMDSIPSAVSSVMLDMNTVLAMQDMFMTLNNDIPNPTCNFVPTCNVSNIDRVDIAKMIGIKESSIRQSDIDVVYRAMFMSDIHRVVSRNWERF